MDIEVEEVFCSKVPLVWVEVWTRMEVDPV